MRINLLLGMLLVVLLTVFTLGCGSSSQENKPAASPPPQSTQQQTTVTMNVTVPQFVDAYNKEIKQRYGEKSILVSEKPVRADTVMYDIPDGKGSQLIINFNQTDKKITKVTFTVQGEAEGKFAKKALEAWTAAVVCATSPGISNDEVIEIRGKILSGTPITKNGIYYMSQYTEKGYPFFQIIARAN